MSDCIQFLGTGGARYAMARQLRSTAGTYLHLRGERILLDMGPGTLTALAQAEPPINPAALDALILTHSHIDHANDVNCVIDAVTAGGLHNRGALFAPAGCIDGEHRVLLHYLRGFLARIETLEPHAKYRVGALEFETSLRHDHGVETFGVRFLLDEGKLSFLIDTRYFPELIDDYAGSRILVINTVRRSHDDAPHALHLSVDDVVGIVDAIQPETTVLTHFGARLIEAGPAEAARRAADATGRRVIAAHDGMRLPVDAARADAAGLSAAEAVE